MSIRNQRKLFLVGCIQFSLSILDLLGLVVIGAVTAFGYSAINGTPVPPSIEFITKLEILNALTYEDLALLFSILAVMVLLTKTLASAYMVRKTIGFLAIREAEISTRYVRNLLTGYSKEIRGKSPQQVSGVAITAANAAITVTLGALTIFIVETLSLSLIFVGISFVDYTVTLPSLFFFFFLSAISIRTLKNRVNHSKTQSYFLGISSSELIRNALATTRDIHLSNLGSQISNEYGNLRFKNYKATRSAAFAASVPKFISEVGLVLGGSFIGLIQVLLKDARGVLIGLVLFIALASRMLPALLRIQNAILEINGSKGATLDFLREFELSEKGLKAFHIDTNKFHLDSLENENVGFSPEIRAENASLSYKTSGTFELSHVSLIVKPGDFIGIVGPSGGGKTTLVDMLAGIGHLNSGSVTISGTTPAQAVIKWPNEIRYVPQDVHLIVGTVRMNLTWPDLESQVRDEDLIRVIEQVGLLPWINNLPNGLDTNVEYVGANMSGGQKQRIGIARALICNPHLLFLDEATSSLDSSTENLITSNVISRLQGVTRIVVAHRISTIQNAHRIIYVANGKIVAEGSFEQIRKMVPDFEEQALQAGF